MASRLDDHWMETMTPAKNAAKTPSKPQAGKASVIDCRNYTNCTFYIVQPGRVGNDWVTLVLSTIFWSVVFASLILR